MITVFKPFGLLSSPRGQNTPFKLDLISGMMMMIGCSTKYFESVCKTSKPSSVALSDLVLRGTHQDTSAISTIVNIDAISTSVMSFTERLFSTPLPKLKYIRSPRREDSEKYIPIKFTMVQLSRSACVRLSDALELSLSASDAAYAEHQFARHQMH